MKNKHKNEHPFRRAMSFSARNHSGLLPYSSGTEQLLDSLLHTPGAMMLPSPCSGITALCPLDLKSQSACSLWTWSHGMQCCHHLGHFKRPHCILSSRALPLADGCLSYVGYGSGAESKCRFKAFRASCWFKPNLPVHNCQVCTRHPFTHVARNRAMIPTQRETDPCFES